MISLSFLLYYAYSLDLDPVWNNYIAIDLAVVAREHSSLILMPSLVKIAYRFCSILWHSEQQPLPSLLMYLRTIWKSSRIAQAPGTN